MRIGDDSRGRAKSRSRKIISPKRISHSSRNQQGNLPMRPGKPCRCQGMRFVHVDQVESAVSHESSHHRSRWQPQFASRRVVHAKPRVRSAMAQRRSSRCEHFRRVPSFVEALQQQEKLVLPTAPFLLQIHQQRNHRSTCTAFFCAAINFPSFSYFKRTVRAAIREINAPRCPSKNPPRKIKF